MENRRLRLPSTAIVRPQSGEILAIPRDGRSPTCLWTRRAIGFRPGNTDLHVTIEHREIAVALSEEHSQALKSEFPDLTWSTFREETRCVVAREQQFELLAYLKKEQGFDLLVDITCVDYLNFRDAVDRFGLVYLLANTETNERINVRCFVNEPDLFVRSVTSLWFGANWMEREVWDMFGVQFQGHPDHRRILMPEEFTAHPLRKDYPLRGRGERHNFPVLERGAS